MNIIKVVKFYLYKSATSISFTQDDFTYIVGPTQFRTSASNTYQDHKI
jgi:hypothetical protein